MVCTILGVGSSVFYAVEYKCPKGLMKSLFLFCILLFHVVLMIN
jgi:hypothetical protein